MKNTAAAYIRVSSGMQVETGASLPSQLAEIRAYCKKNGLELIEDHIYTDAGESARSDDRPAFQAMISAARQRPAPFNVIVCWENSRFARSREDAITYKALLKKNCVDLRFVKQDFEDTPMGQFMEGIVELVDEWYSKNLAVETKRGLIENARQGYAGGGTPPYGLRRAVKLNEFGKEKAIRELDPDTAPIVREIFEMRVEKKMGYRAIAYALNARGIRSPKGGDWSANTIYYMLTKNQPAYLGHLVFNRADHKTPGQKDKPQDEWVVVENAWSPIVTQEMVDKVNELVRKSSAGTPPGTVKKPNAAPFVLSGKVFCGLCGRSMNGVTSGRKGAWRYYRCTKARDAGAHACSLPQIAQKRIEDAVFNVFQEKVLTDGFLEEMIGIVKEGRDVRNAGEKDREVTISKNIAVLEKRKRNLLLAIEDGTVEAKDVKTRFSELNGQIAELQNDLKRIKAELQPLPPASKWNLKTFREQLMSFFQLEPASALEKVVDGFVDRIDVFPDHVEVSLLLEYHEGGCKSGVQSGSKNSRNKHKKTALDKVQSGMRDCKFNYGAEGWHQYPPRKL